MMTNLIQRTSVEEKEEDTPDVDDNDGIDPEGEFEAWRLRELGRIKRDKEDEVRREEEREEIERRRALPEEQRLREDMEHADKTRSDKPKGQQKFLQKYWHKGAFHQVSDRATNRADPNSDESSELTFFTGRRDFTTARLYRSHCKHHGCFHAAKGHASKEFRQTGTHEIYTFG
jgi:hypothetical protein